MTNAIMTASDADLRNPSPPTDHAAAVLAAALDLARQGRPVFPILPNDKKPAFVGGHNHATTDETIIQSWFGPGGQCEGYNLGERQGAITKDPETGSTYYQVVIDLDRKHGKDGLKALAQRCKENGFDLRDIADTLTQLTPSNGIHLVYRTTTELKQGASVAGIEGCDVRNGGGYIVVAPSIVDGVAYRWQDPDVDIAVMDPRLETLFPKSHERKASAAGQALDGIDLDRAERRAIAYLAGLPETPIGERNETGYRVAAYLKDLGNDKPTTAAMMAAHWKAPGVSVEDCEKLARNAFLYGKEPQGIKAPEAVFAAAPIDPTRDPLHDVDRWCAPETIRANAKHLTVLLQTNRGRLDALRRGWDAFGVMAAADFDDLLLDTLLAGWEISCDAVSLANHRVQDFLLWLRSETPAMADLMAGRLTAAGIGKAQIREAMAAAKRRERQRVADAARENDDRTPIFYDSTRLWTTANAVEAALLKEQGDGQIFNFGGSYSTIVPAPQVTVRDLVSGDNSAGRIVRQLDIGSMAERISQKVRLEIKSGDDEIKASSVPDPLVRNLLSRRGGSAPILTGLTENPLIMADGSIIDCPGYDTKTGLLAAFDADRYAAPVSMTRDDAKAALRFIEDQVLAEFPFAEPVDKSAAAAALLTGYVRPVLLGEAPGFLIGAPVQASGKTALARLIAHASTGRPPAVLSWPYGDEEMQKQLLSVLRQAPRAVFFDNIKDGATIDSASLAAAMTNPSLAGRILGSTVQIAAPTNCLWLCTGNNVKPSGDLTSRFVPIYLDPLSERPDQRTFKRNLTSWVEDKRPEIVQAAMTIIGAYQAAGRPQIDNAVTRFASWDDLVLRPLIFAGGVNVREKIDQGYAEDPTLATFRELLAAWRSLFGGDAVTCTDLLGRIKSSLPAKSDDGSGTDAAKKQIETALETLANLRSRETLTVNMIGRVLGRFENRFAGGLHLLRVHDRHSKTNKWSVASAAE